MWCRLCIACVSRWAERDAANFMLAAGMWRSMVHKSHRFLWALWCSAWRLSHVSATCFTFTFADSLAISGQSAASGTAEFCWISGPRCDRVGWLFSRHAKQVANAKWLNQKREMGASKFRCLRCVCRKTMVGRTLSDFYCWWEIGMAEGRTSLCFARS